MEQRAALYASLSSMVAGLLLSFELHNPISVPNIYNDIVSFYDRGWITNGQFPYVHEFFEYPPVSGTIAYVSRIIGGDLAGYYNVFGMLSLVAGAVLVWSCWEISKLRGSHLKSFYFMLPSVLIYGIYNFDLFHAMFVMLSLQALLMGRKSTSALALALAISTKLASAVLVPVFLIQIRDKRELLKFIGMMVLVIGAINLPLVIANIGNWFQTYTYIGNFGLEDAWFIWIFGDPHSFAAKLFGFGIMGILLLRVYTLKMDVATKSFLALIAYLLGTYIYSPQFNLMIIPFLAILSVEHPSMYFWDAANALIILTWFLPTPLPTSLCPSQSCPTLPWTLPQGFALLRAVMLGWMGAAILKREGWNLASLLPFRRQKTLDEPSLSLGGKG
jgi:hypothetical protein